MPWATRSVVQGRREEFGHSPEPASGWSRQASRRLCAVSRSAWEEPDPGRSLCLGRSTARTSQPVTISFSGEEGDPNADGADRAQLGLRILSGMDGFAGLVRGRNSSSELIVDVGVRPRCLGC